MAGLEYKFFPTDFYYPRPAQPTTPVVDSVSTTPSTALIQKDDGHGTKQPATLVLRRNNKKTSVSMRRQGEKRGRIYIRNRADQVKLPRNSFSLLISIPDDEERADSRDF